MACDATARLYDVDEKTVVFRKLDKSQRYDQGTVTFRARRGKWIDLDKLHESIWATRLSGGTRSGLVSLQVTTMGRVVASEGKTMLQVDGFGTPFILERHPDAEHATAFDKLESISSDRVVTVTGVIDDYKGRWPDVLSKPPPKTRRILVTDVDTAKAR